MIIIVKNIIKRMAVNNKKSISLSICSSGIENGGTSTEVKQLDSNTELAVFSCAAVVLDLVLAVASLLVLKTVSLVLLE